MDLISPAGTGVAPEAGGTVASGPGEADACGVAVGFADVEASGAPSVLNRDCAFSLARTAIVAPSVSAQNRPLISMFHRI
jgi:hypothetical protein